MSVSSFLEGRQFSPVSPGLYLVATPIGNLEDITLRAVRVFEQADYILCEDTRVTGKLMQAFSLKKQLIPYHAHNERQTTEKIIAMLQDGKTFALVSDAGMPLLQDPGFPLVQACRTHSIPMTCLPGATAPIAALALSGFATSPFTFHGYIPEKQQARQQFLTQLTHKVETAVMFEAPHRLLVCLEDITRILGDRPMVVARELTKMYEEVRPGTAADLHAHYTAHLPKGEIVLVLQGYIQDDTDDWQSALREALGRLSTKEAVAEIASVYDLPRKQVYTEALSYEK